MSTAEDYRRFCDWLERLSGIALGENKRYLVDSRLAVLMTDLGVSGLADLLDHGWKGTVPGGCASAWWTR